MKKLNVYMKEMETEARNKAKKHVTNLFQNAGQLDKIEQLKHTYARKKCSTEAKMRCAMQSELDGAREGMCKLTDSLSVMKGVELHLKGMNNMIKDMPDFDSQLIEIRDENMRHSQYVIAKESLKYIFNVPDNVEKTRELINEEKLLLAHQCLRELEHSRDDLFLELYRLPNQSKLDTAMLKAYFADVEELSELLEKKIKIILSRTLNTVRKDPALIVSVLRIIEREEKADREETDYRSEFKPPGRPKRWKAMAYETMKKSVEIRIQGTQIEDRNDNKMWLVRFLELIRQVFLEDLRVVSSLCVPCFPPQYDIFQQYIVWYHEALSEHLEDLIQSGLEGNEYFSLLSWVLNTYNSEELMGHPALREYTSHIPPLLSEKIVKKLLEDYLDIMEKNYKQWLQNTLNKEKEEWYSNNQPQMDTATPVIIFKMINENLDVAKSINQDLAYKALILSLDQVIKYSYIYEEAIIEFKNKHFEDRSKLMYFTFHMMTILNNCHQLTELGGQLLLLYCTENSPEALSVSFKILSETFIELRNRSGQYLLEEVFLDIEKHFNELFTSKWTQVNCQKQVDTICATLDDYFQDYRHLVEPNLRHIVTEARYKICKKYLTAMLSKKIYFKTEEESRNMSDKIVREVRLIQKVFHDAGFGVDEDNDCFEIIVTLAEILKSESTMVPLDLHVIIKKCPDVTEDHLLRLMYLRGDLTKSDVRDMIKSALENSVSNTGAKHSIFKQLVFPKMMTLGF